MLLICTKISHEPSKSSRRAPTQQKPSVTCWARSKQQYVESELPSEHESLTLARSIASTLRATPISSTGWLSLTSESKAFYSNA